jgi:uncharacterized membrane protein YbhN (UPF0104 family)
MTPTRVRTLLLIAVVLAVVSWLLLRAVYGSLPSVPWTMVPALVIAAGGEAITGRGLRARILGRPGAKPVPPLQVARVAALAKASSLAAAVIGGVAAGFAAAAGGSLPARAAGHDVLTGSVTFGAAVLLPGPGRPGRRALRAAAPAPHGPLPPMTAAPRTGSPRTAALGTGRHGR